ncbi:MAG: tautomerase family protein [Verrucomicrobiota bacterium JB022]|nr:tautomerase family protein [Verrucomicrobiota bacterium JB022]
MPHIAVKVIPGKTEAQKQRLADAITRDVVEIFGYEEAAVSIALEEIPAERWKEDVYLPEIQGHPQRLLKEPGYQL